MSKEGGGGTEKKQSTTRSAHEVDKQDQPESQTKFSHSQEQTLLKHGADQQFRETPRAGEESVAPKIQTESQGQSSPSTTAETINITESRTPDSRKTEGQASIENISRQVIAVSASKKPAVFFNLARKFLATDEECDLSALEGAILTAVDAAHLLERSKIATIVRIRTSYVSVEPKRKKQPSPSGVSSVSEKVSSALTEPPSIEALHQEGLTIEESGRHRKSITSGRAKGVPLRRARMVITVRRTKDYEAWLEETPYEAIIAGDEDLGEEEQSKLSSQTAPSEPKYPSKPP